MLSRLAIELDEMPYQYENFSVQTWVEDVYRLFTDRNFAIIEKDGKKKMCIRGRLNMSASALRASSRIHEEETIASRCV